MAKMALNSSPESHWIKIQAEILSNETVLLNTYVICLSLFILMAFPIQIDILHVYD